MTSNAGKAIKSGGKGGKGSMAARGMKSGGKGQQRSSGKAAPGRTPKSGH
jgi:hypothetical protein